MRDKTLDLAEVFSVLSPAELAMISERADQARDVTPDRAWRLVFEGISVGASKALSKLTPC
jgi:hypothetical protein